MQEAYIMYVVAEDTVVRQGGKTVAGTRADRRRERRPTVYRK